MVLLSKISSYLSIEVGGMPGDEIVIMDIFDSVHERGFLLTVDCSKAFDCLGGILSSWPTSLVDLLAAIRISKSGSFGATITPAK